MDEFKEGDTVYLKTGSPAMKVDRVWSNADKTVQGATCEWFIEDEQRSSNYLFTELTSVAPNP